MKKVLLLLFLLILMIFLVGCGREAYKYDAFADCLAQKGAKMYGTDWCPHCKNQKEMFGSSFDLVGYVDCDASPGECGEAGVTGYPTWIMPDGTALVGTQSLETLAEKAGCELPEDE